MTASASWVRDGESSPRSPKLRRVDWHKRALLAIAETAPGPRRGWEPIFDQEITSAGGSVARASGGTRTIAFTDPAVALECAIRIQQALDGRDSGRLAMSLHGGTVIQEGDAVFGRNVMIACGVAKVAGAGEVLATRELRDLVPDAAARFSPAGTVTLEGVRGTLELFSVMWRTSDRGEGE